MELVKQGKISCLQARWSTAGALAGVTTRNGGISRPPYNSLNLGSNTDDAAYNVEGNRSVLALEFGIPLHQLLLVKQVHGSDVLVVNSENADVSHFQDVEADAIVSNQRGLMIGVTVADCYPVLLFDPQQQVVAAVHVGWRGAAAGIIGKTLQVMEAEFSSRAADVLAAVGPGISARHYVVGKDVRDAFRAAGHDWNSIAEEQSLGKWQLDLKESCRLQLAAAGIKPGHCEISEPCTYRHKELFFSYRRDQGKTGRQLGYVLLR
ncbi:MAG: peptidoglycan editing factor PgeF [Desulfuromonadaceae bacterium]|nr:peptidoglycan editing factor PgeF [Desulfuromonadaceae bacterium]